LLLAVVAAVFAAGLAKSYLDGQLKRGQAATTPVVVAARDVQLGTALTSEHLKVVQWPQDAELNGHHGGAEELLGRVVVTKVLQGEPIVDAKLAHEGAGSGLSAVVPPGWLAVSVKVDDVVGVAGFIHPGDNVDVIVTMRPQTNSNTPPVSKIAIQNIRVLAVGSQMDRDEKRARKALPVTVATLMVDPAQAERLAMAATQGKLLLALRSSLDQEVVTTAGVTPPTLLAGQTWSPAPTRIRRKPKVAEPEEPKPVRQVVEILRGDQIEQRSFEQPGGVR
jgi:pilus assembly protein CpaB